MIWLNRNLFIMPGYYGLCTTPEDFAKAMKRLKVPEKDWDEPLGTPHADATTHTLKQKDKLCFIVYMPKAHAEKYSTEECYGLLVHEGIHIWQKVLGHIGEHAPSKEFEAYAVQTIAQQLMNAWKEATTKSKTKPKKLTSKKR